MGICELCRSKSHDDIKYGRFLSHRGVSVHEYCLYLSSGLSQRGKDDKDIIGFLVQDIKREKKRISKLNCCYCGQSYANIGCCATKCYRNFHLKCGTEQGAKFEFISTFKSFCDRHLKARDKVLPKRDEICCICYDQLISKGPRNSYVQMLRAPCCKNGWFHKICLQKFAKTAGYFFKCPLCNNTDKFREKLSYSGIFIPDRDAEWELEPNAFGELLERPNNCSAENCISRTSEGNPFVFCLACGSVAMHKLCLLRNEQRTHFECDDCKNILQLYNDSGTSTIQYDTEIKEEDDDSEIDVCNDGDASETLALENDEDNRAEEDGLHQIDSKTTAITNYSSSEEEEEESKVHKSKTLKRLQIISDESDDGELKNSILILEKDKSFSASEDNASSTRQLNEPFGGLVKKRRPSSDSGNESKVNSTSISVLANSDIKPELYDVDINHNRKNQYDDDDISSDDDPLENFDLFLAKKAAQEAKNDSEDDEINVASHSIKRKKRHSAFIIMDSSSESSSFHSTSTKKANSPQYKSTTPTPTRCEIIQNKTNLNEETERSQLNTSFTGTRTRDKSLSTESSEEESNKTTENSLSDNSLPLSCIANRTRTCKSRILSRIDEADESDSTQSETFHSVTNIHANSCGSSSRDRNSCDSSSASGSESSLLLARASGRASSLSSSLPSSSLPSSSSSSSPSSSSSDITSASLSLSPFIRRKSRVLLKRLSSTTFIQQRSCVCNSGAVGRRALSSSEDDEPHQSCRSSRRRSAASTYAAKLPHSAKHFDPYVTPKFTRVNGKLKRCL